MTGHEIQRWCNLVAAAREEARSAAMSVAVQNGDVVAVADLLRERFAEFTSRAIAAGRN